VHPRRIVIVGLALGAAASTARGQMPNDSIMHYARLPIHGVISWGPAIRQHVVSDRHALDVYASLLDGTSTTTVRWNPYVALYWLAESGEPKYVPILLRFSKPSANQPPIENQLMGFVAAYGPARDAAVDDAANRLRAMARDDDPTQRRLAVHALVQVNDTVTRALIREIPTAQLPPAVRQEVADALRGPALAHGEGHMFCDGREQRGVAADGGYRCSPRQP
jgi:hypothetical protein